MSCSPAAPRLCATSRSHNQLTCGTRPCSAAKSCFDMSVSYCTPVRRAERAQTFGNSYGQPARHCYHPPPDCGSSWDIVVLNYTATSNGTQYDRLSVGGRGTWVSVIDLAADRLALARRDLAHLNGRADAYRDRLDRVRTISPSVSLCDTSTGSRMSLAMQHSLPNQAHYCSISVTCLTRVTT
jgi:hypothetical protein